MNTNSVRRSRRPKLHLPRFLEALMAADADRERSPFPMTPEQLRRSVAEMIG